MEIKWIKLSTDLFSNRKISLIETMPEGDTFIVIWIRLLTLAGEINDGGLVYVTQDLPYTSKTLAAHMHKKEEDVQKALATFEDFKMIQVKKNGLIEILNWEKYQNIEGMEKIKEQNRVRQQKKRAKDKAEQLSRDSHDDKSRDITQQIRIDKKRIDKNRLEEKEESEGKTIEDTSPQELLRRLTKKMNQNAIYGNDMEVNGR